MPSSFLRNILEIKNFSANLGDKAILRGVNMRVPTGEIHAIMGPNGSGKSTLAKVIAGHPSFSVTTGSIAFEGQNITEETPESRAHSGIFLVHQHPREISGVHFRNFLSAISREKVLSETGLSLSEARKDKTIRKKVSPILFKKEVTRHFQELKMPTEFLDRSLNEGLSGGEKKKSEILQMEMLKPRLVILDELDSGLDVDALRLLCKRIREIHEQEKMTIILITHYPKILEYLPPNVVHLLVNGKIEQSGDIRLAKKIEEAGYAK